MSKLNTSRLVYRILWAVWLAGSICIGIYEIHWLQIHSPLKLTGDTVTWSQVDILFSAAVHVVALMISGVLGVRSLFGVLVSDEVGAR